jgi:hypothetical protein
VPAGLTGVTAIAAGGVHNLALRSDGTVVAWGSNLIGESNVPTGLNGVVAIAAGDVRSLALKNDGTVVAWGLGGQTSVPAGLTGVTAIAAGVVHFLALKEDGTVVAWGSNSHGQTDVPAGLSGVTAVAGGISHSLALKEDGTVVAWGANDSGQTNVPAGLTGVTAIAAGASHSLALIGAAPEVSAHGWFGTDGNGQVAFTVSNQTVTLTRGRGERFTFAGDVATVTGCGRAASLTGAGIWNGKSGYTFEVSAVDNAPWGRLEDTIEVVIRDPLGAVAFTSSGPQLLKQGDIEVMPAE